MSRTLSLLDLVDLCDNVRPTRPGHTGAAPKEFDNERLIPFYLSQSSESPIIGLLRPLVIDRLSRETKDVWDIQPNRVSFHSSISTPSLRSAAMTDLCERWRDEELFPNVCGSKKWRAEMYPIWKDPLGIQEYPENGKEDDDTTNYAFEMERSACALFGVTTYGVHLSIYEQDANGLRIWVPTRARTKQTWPGYLDNSVAGGIPSGLAKFESLVKECMEEASIEEYIVRQYVRSTGAISYFFRTTEGWLQPEVEYVYDLLIPSNHPNPALFVPKPLDGEVESFELLDVQTIRAKMSEGLFKPNSGIAIIDLLIRLGYVTPENEPNFLKILTRIHNDFDYSRWKDLS